MVRRQIVRRQTFINKIRALGYAYKSQQKRTMLYRRKGSTQYISVPRPELLEDAFVKNTLRQSGVSTDEIEQFLKSAKS